MLMVQIRSGRKEGSIFFELIRRIFVVFLFKILNSLIVSFVRKTGSIHMYLKQLLYVILSKLGLQGALACFSLSFNLMFVYVVLFNF